MKGNKTNMSTDKTLLALVTGANKGIGHATARKLGQMNYAVWLGCRDRLPPSAGEEFIEDIRTIFETSTFGPVRITQAFLPMLRKSRSGRIVMVSSGLGSHALTKDITSEIWGAGPGGLLCFEECPQHVYPQVCQGATERGHQSERGRPGAHRNRARREVVDTPDAFSQEIAVTQLTGLLNYAERFYRRQFVTRKKDSHALIARLEAFVNGYLQGGNPARRGSPSVQEVARALNVSPGYLSETVRLLTGRGTQVYLHDRLIEHAKTGLATGERSVSEVGYALGFQHPQSFSKFFRAKTGQPPSAFRAEYIDA